MTWFRVDDGFSEHHKLEALESEPRLYMAAITVWTIMGADCARRLSDGFVSRARLEKVLCKLGKAANDGAAALVRCGLWHEESDGWRYHDWHDYQPTKQSVDASRKQKADRQRRWRSARVDASTRESTDASQDASRDASEVSAPARVSRPVPSRPDPTPVVPEPDNAQHDRSPMRFRQLLEDEVRSEFFRREETPQKAHDSQWRDGCQTVQDALKLGIFPDAHEAIGVFAGLLVDACTRRDKPEKLGFALQQTTLSRREPEPITAMVYRIREGA